MNEITIKTPDSLKDGATMTSLEMVDFINAVSSGCKLIHSSD